MGRPATNNLINKLAHRIRMRFIGVQVSHQRWVATTKVPSTSTQTLTNSRFASEAGQADPDRKMVLHKR